MIFGAQNIANFSAGNFSPDGYVPWDPYVNYEDEVTSFTTDTGLVSTFKSKYRRRLDDNLRVHQLRERHHAGALSSDTPQDPRLLFRRRRTLRPALVKLLDRRRSPSTSTCTGSPTPSRPTR